MKKSLSMFILACAVIYSSIGTGQEKAGVDSSTEPASSAVPAETKAIESEAAEVQETKKKKEDDNKYDILEVDSDYPDALIEGAKKHSKFVFSTCDCDLPKDELKIVKPQIQCNSRIGNHSILIEGSREDRKRLARQSENTTVIQVSGEIIDVLKQGQTKVLVVRAAELSETTESCGIKPSKPFASESKEQMPEQKKEEVKKEEPKKTEEVKQTPPYSDFDSQWHFALGVGHTLSNTNGHFAEGTYTDSGGSVGGTADLKYRSAPSVVLEARWLRRQDWGFEGGLNYESKRDFDSGSLSSGGTTVTLVNSGNASALQFTTFYANAVYRWDEVYLPFGLNLSSVIFTPATGVTATADVTGGVGAQVGIGWTPTEHFSLELYSWVTAMKLKITSPTSTADFGTGYFSNAFLFAKLVF